MVPKKHQHKWTNKTKTKQKNLHKFCYIKKREVFPFTVMLNPKPCQGENILFLGELDNSCNLY